MRVIATLAATAFAAGALAAAATPAYATECTPKGCTASCWGGGVHVDPASLTVFVEPPECSN